LRRSLACTASWGTVRRIVRKMVPNGPSDDVRQERLGRGWRSNADCVGTPDLVPTEDPAQDPRESDGIPSY
jgi:hypothetical protein